MRRGLKNFGRKVGEQRAALVATLLFAAPVTCLAQAPSPPNHLADSADPYLRLHAHNPVDWYPWGPAAFAKAKAEGKPIFLSIGYSTCYWCHVAEKTIYSDPAIAALMNQWFVNVKVDREQRPDVDRLYIIATEMLTQHGAWPNNLFLTPDGKPFFAGSYFPPKDDGDTMGFPHVLAAIHDLWANHRADKVEPAAADLYGALQKLAAAQCAKAAVPVVPRAWLKTASAGLLRAIDPVNGGLGSSTSGQKFPQAPALDLLLAAATLDNDEPSRAALTNALEAMAYGGIHDQLGGGFHRYATDPTWTIPHFEKMLSDNAQLLALYTRAYAPSRTPQLRDMALDVAGYLLRDMQDPDGGFYTAQDAAIDGVEGASYLWTRAQIQDELGAFDTGRFLAVYEIAPMPESDRPNAPGGVLRVRVPIEESVRRVGATDRVSMLNAVATLRADLLTRRRDRPQPAIDKKIVTSSNGLTIGALARAGVDLDRPDFIEAARKAADLIWSRGFDAKGRLVHEIIDGKAEVDGYIDDYAMLGDGFLALADATKDTGWRTRAARLADAILARFAQPDGRLVPASGDGLLVTLGDDADADVPSPTSAALTLLAQLGREEGGARFEAAAAKLAVATSGRIAARPTAWPSAIAALARYPIAPAALVAAIPSQPKVLATATPPSPPATSDHVHASAKVEGDTIAVTLKVDPGYHINAHKPSLNYLVPTDLSFSGLKPAAIDYPAAMRFKSAFAPDGLDVYEGDVPLVARFPVGTLSGVMGLEGRITAQACDAKTCLPPTELAVSVRNGG